MAEPIEQQIMIFIGYGRINIAANNDIHRYFAVLCFVQK